MRRLVLSVSIGAVVILASATWQAAVEFDHAAHVENPVPQDVYGLPQAGEEGTHQVHRVPPEGLTY